MKNLIIGLLLGGIIVYFFLDKSSETKTEIVTEAEVESADPVEVVETKIEKVVGRIDKSVKLKKLNLYSKLKLKKGEFVTAQTENEKPKKKLKLNLDSSALGFLENSWDELPDHAYSERLDEGWKIGLKRKDSFFSRFGFKDGDVIHYESLAGNGLSERQEELIERVVAILRHIEE